MYAVSLSAHLLLSVLTVRCTSHIMRTLLDLYYGYDYTEHEHAVS
jgi:hypothetical protein